MPNDPKISFKSGGKVYDIPTDKREAFLLKYPDAIEVSSFVSGKDTFDIPVGKIEKFKTKYPDAKPLSGTPQASPEKKNLVGTSSQNGSQGLPDTQALPSSEPTRATPLEGLGGQPSYASKIVDISLNPPPIVKKHVLDGQPASRESVKRNFSDRSFVDAFVEGGHSVSINAQEDPELKAFVDRQINSRKTNDVWDSFMVSLNDVGKMGAGSYLYINDLLEEATGMPNPLSVVLTGLNPSQESKVGDLVNAVSGEKRKEVEAVLDKFIEQSEYSQEQRFKVEGDFIDQVKKGDVKEAVNMAINTTAESSIPSLLIGLGAAATGGGIGIAALAKGGLAVTPLFIGGEYADQLKSDDEAIKRLSTVNKFLRPAIRGGAEMAGEVASTAIWGGSMKVAASSLRNMVGQAAIEVGVEAAEQVAKEGGKQLAEQMLKSFAIDPLGEGVSELATYLAQESTDQLMGISNKTMPEIAREGLNSFALGFASGQVMTTPANVGTAIKMSAEGVRASKKFFDESISVDPSFLTDLNEAVDRMPVSEEQKESIKENVAKREKAVKAVPKDMVEDTETVDLVEEKQAKKEQAKGLDPIFAAPIEEEIAEIDAKLSAKVRKEYPAPKVNTTPTDAKYASVNRNDGKGTVELTQEEYLAEMGRRGTPVEEVSETKAEPVSAPPKKESAPPFLSTLGGTPVKGPSETMAEGVFQTEVDGVDVLMSEVDGNTVKLESIRTPEAQQRQGKARKVLAKITAKADELGKAIVLDVVPKEKVIKDVNDNPKKYGFHGGNLKNKSDYLTIGYRGEQPFTGHYFFSDRERAEERGNRGNSAQESMAVDFSKYNLLKPTTNGYWALKSGIKQITDNLSNDYDIDGNIDRISLFVKDLGDKLNTNKESIKEWYKEWESIKNENFATKDFEKSRTERFETFLLKKLGYEGIDVRGLKEQNGEGSPDKATEGSVIFDLKPNTVVNISPITEEGLRKLYEEAGFVADGKISMRREPVKAESKIEEAPIVVSEDKVKQEEVDEDILSLEDLRNAMSRVVSKGFTESPEGQARKLARTYTNMGKRGRKTPLGVQVFADLQKVVKENGYTLQPNKTGGFTVLDKNGKAIKKPKAASSREEKAEAKTERKEIKETRSAALMMNPISIEHWVAQRIASGTRFKKSELLGILGSKADIVPWLWAEKGLSLEGEEFLEKLKGEGFTSTLGELEAREKAASEIAKYAHSSGKKEAIDYVEKVYEESTKEKDPYAGYTEEDYLEIEAHRQRINLAMNPDLAIEIMSLEFMPEDVAQHVLDNMKAQEEYESSTQYLSDIQKQIKGYEDKQKGKRKNATGKKADGDTSEAAKIAKRLRDKKIGGVSFVDPLFGAIGISKTIYDGALELAARQVEKGTKLGAAIANAIKYIDERMSGKKWDKGLFGRHLNDQFKMTVNGKEVEVKRDLSTETLDVVNGWYSPLEKSIKDTKADSLTAKEWLDKVRSKEGEDFWTGLRGMLESKNPKDRVSKRELLNFLKDNRVDVVEVVKEEETANKAFEGWSDEEVADHIVDEMGADPDDVERMGRLQMETWAEQNADFDYEGQATGTTKFSQYQLEGEKENYKEVLVTVPKKEPAKLPEVRITSTTEDGLTLWNGYIGDLKIASNHATELKAQEATESWLKLNPTGIKNIADSNINFRSSHFDEPNILVHLRMNTRVDAEGKKVLFLEEVQSDWGQQGKKEGFKEPSFQWDTQLGKDAVVVLKRMSAGNKTQNWQQLATAMAKSNDILNDFQVPYDSKDLMLKWHKAVNQERKVPTAPFVTDTNSWVKLGVKVALKEAVAQGVDKIAWTTGEQQNERYDLSKQVNKIEVEAVEEVDGVHFVDIELSNGKTENIEVENGVIREGSYKGQSLEDVIGKEYAEKVLSTPRGETKTLEGADLKLGGKGMKGFYGSPKENSKGILGSVVESITGQKVERTNLDTGDAKYDAEKYNASQDISGIPGNDFIREGDWIIKDPNGNFIWSEEGEMSKSKAIENFKEASEEAGSPISEGAGIGNQPSIEITPELKAAVEKGQPLFGSNLGLEKARQDLKDAWKAFKDEGKNLGFADTPENKGKRLADLEIAVQKALIAFARKYVASLADKAKVKVEALMREFADNGIEMTRRIAEDILDVVVPIRSTDTDAINRVQKEATKEEREKASESTKEKVAKASEKATEKAKQKYVNIGYRIGEAFGKLGGEIRGKAEGRKEGKAEAIKTQRQFTKSVDAIISEAIADAKKKSPGFTVSANQLAAASKKLLSVNFNSPISIQKAIEYVDKVLNNATYANDVARTKSLKDTNRKRLNRNDYGIDDGSMSQALKVEHEQLSIEELADYMAFLKGISKGPYNKAENIALVEKYANMYREQKEAVQEPISEEQEEGNKKRELSRNDAKQEAIDEFEFERESMSEPVAEAYQKDYTFLKSLTEAELDTLSEKKLMELSNAIRNMREDIGFMSGNAANTIRTLRADRVSEEGKRITEGRDFKQLLRDLILPIKVSFRGAQKMTQTDKMKRLISMMPLNRIDAAMKGKTGQSIHDTFVQPISTAFSVFSEKMTQIDKGYDRLYSKVGKSLIPWKREQQRQDEMVKLSLIAIQKEYESNPNNEEVSPLSDYIEAIREAATINDDYAKFAEKYLAIYESMLDSDGNFDYVKQEELLDADTKAFYDYAQSVNASNTPFVEVSAIRNGENVSLRQAYTPISVALIDYSNLSEVQDMANRFSSDDNVKPTAQSGNIKKRTRGGKPLYLDFHRNAKKATRSVLLDYYMREPLRVASRAFNKMAKDPEMSAQSRAFFKGLESNIAQVVKNTFVNEYFEGGLGTLIAETLKKRGYQMALASIPRAGVEFASNMTHAIINKPRELVEGAKILAEYKGNDEDLRTLAIFAESAQISRMFERSMSIMSEQGSNTKGSSSAYGRAIDKAADAIMSTPDRALARPIWLGSFSRTFEQVSGTPLDIQQMINSPEYRQENAAAISTARNVADINLSQGFASMNPFEGVVASQVTKSDGMRKTFDKYMTRFMRYEFQSAADALNGLVGRNELSKREASALLAATMVRMAAYQFAMSYAMDGFYSLIEAATGTGPEDDEEDNEELNQKISSAVIGSVISMLVFRRLGNWAKVPIAWGIETLNSKFGEEAGLRNGEYDPYNNSLVFSPIAGDIKGSDLANDSKIIPKFMGPYGPIAKTAFRAKELLARTGVQDGMGGYLIQPSAKSQETIDKANNELAVRIIPELFMQSIGAPVPRDIRNLIIRDVFKDFKESGKSETSVNELRKEKVATVQEIKDSEVARLKTDLKGEYIDTSTLSDIKTSDVHEKLSDLTEDPPSKSKLKVELAEMYNTKIFSEKEPKLAAIFVTDDGKGNSFGDDYLIMASQYKDGFLKNNDPLKIKEGDEKKIMTAMQYLYIVKQRKYIQKVNEQFQNIPEKP
jgi:hypothetical protein